MFLFQKSDVVRAGQPLPLPRLLSLSANERGQCRTKASANLFRLFTDTHKTLTEPPQVRLEEEREREEGRVCERVSERDRVKEREELDDLSVVYP